MNSRRVDPRLIKPFEPGDVVVVNETWELALIEHLFPNGSFSAKYQGETHHFRPEEVRYPEPEEARRCVEYYAEISKPEVLKDHCEIHFANDSYMSLRNSCMERWSAYCVDAAGGAWYPFWVIFTALHGTLVYPDADVVSAGKAA